MLIVLAHFLADNMTEEPGQAKFSCHFKDYPGTRTSSSKCKLLALVNVMGDTYARCSICGIDIGAYYGRRNYRIALYFRGA